MAQPAGPSPEQMRQMQQQFLAEAAKKGMTPSQFQEHQRQQLAADAAKQGLTVEQYVNLLKQRAMQEHQIRQQQAQQQAQQHQAQGQGQGQVQGQGQGQGQGQNQGQAHQHQHPQTQKIPVNPGVAPKPEALAVAKFLKSQDLKTRTCILDGQRKEMFKGNVPPSNISAWAHTMLTSQTCIPGITIISLQKSPAQKQVVA
jgi:translocation protein SEC62